MPDEVERTFIDNVRFGGIWGMLAAVVVGLALVAGIVWLACRRS